MKKKKNTVLYQIIIVSLLISFCFSVLAKAEEPVLEESGLVEETEFLLQKTDNREEQKGEEDAVAEAEETDTTPAEPVVEENTERFSIPAEEPGTISMEEKADSLDIVLSEGKEVEDIFDEIATEPETDEVTSESEELPLEEDVFLVEDAEEQMPDADIMDEEAFFEDAVPEETNLIDAVSSEATETESTLETVTSEKMPIPENSNEEIPTESIPVEDILVEGIETTEKDDLTVFSATEKNNKEKSPDGKVVVSEENFEKDNSESKVKQAYSVTEKNGFYKVNGQWKYYKDGKVQKVTGLVKGTINGKTQWYYVKKGTYKKDFTGTAKKVNKEESPSYYVKNGKQQETSGFKKVNGKVCLFTKNGTLKKVTGLVKGKMGGKEGWFYVKNGVFQKYNGIATKSSGDKTKTFFVKNGKMIKGAGWETVKNKTYYFAKSGVAIKGWKTIKGKTYYFDPKGILKKGVFQRNGKTYCADKDGVIQKGFITINGKTYYTSSKGQAATGWRTIKKDIYYFTEKGVMVTGTKTIDGRKCTFNKQGILQSVSTGDRPQKTEPEEPAPEEEKTEPEESPAKPHKHTWTLVYTTIHHNEEIIQQPVYTCIHHEATTHEETVMEEQPVYGGRSYEVCNKCGYEELIIDDGKEDKEAERRFAFHLLNSCQTGHHNRTEQYIKGYETVEVTKTVIDEPAWDEYVLDYYETVETIPAWDEKKFDHYECQECGEIDYE